ncbi:MAG: hypothetical protein KAJ00_04400 [Deltaproteobacteria bacterium]|nr:hypothetical protein [Deltaproteobacteria bacterium]
MKKMFVILMVLIVFGMIGGELYNTLAKLDAVEEEVSEYASMNPFPYEMPDVVMDPATGYSLF